jgi:hypothetical protein
LLHILLRWNFLHLRFGTDGDEWVGESQRVKEIFAAEEYLVFGGKHQDSAIEEELHAFGERKIGVRYFLTHKLFVVAIFANQHRIISFRFVIESQYPDLKRLLFYLSAPLPGK